MQKFTPEEWDICLKVLNILKDNPLENPDNEVFKTLITQIHKNARKAIKKESASNQKINDLNTKLTSTISLLAVNNTTSYEAKELSEKKTIYRTLEKDINCYCCNQPFNLLHFFYNRLCPECAEFNYNKRFEEIDLSNRNIILTGGRVKIGFATALKLLRSGANLILTTRFPALALEQLQNEKDYCEWENRLTVYGLDLRNIEAVNNFILYVKDKVSYLDILINNAAQTIRYTDEYYAPLIKKEMIRLQDFSTEYKLISNQTSISNSIKLIDMENIVSEFNQNRFGQPVDNREKNSWNSKLDEISTLELLEVNLINHISPYILIKELKPLLKKSSFKERFIINVTSSEGQFSYTNKTIFHPHTNMTKAALNMLTRTSAKEFVDDNIYMNSVDVGWISTGAKENLRKEQFNNGYIPPLDSVDGASRIIDPIREIIIGNKHLYGKLLKNYHVTNW